MTRTTTSNKRMYKKYTWLIISVKTHNKQRVQKRNKNKMPDAGSFVTILVLRGIASELGTRKKGVTIIATKMISKSKYICKKIGRIF